MTALNRHVPVEWRAGDLIDGRYRVLGTLGRGGTGVVHRVRHLGWGTDLAVKSPRPEMFRSAADHERFIAEAEAWVSLGLHPHVCTCHYVRTLGAVPRVFAEYVPGGSLRDRIEGRGLYDGGPAEATARVLDVAIQLAWGLDHAHGRGLVHQDIKPANVLLDDAGTAKITGFGPARARNATGAGSDADADAASGATLLVPGSGGMTPAYASPEQFARGPLGRRSDMFAFAVTVLEMLIGEVSWKVGPAAGAALAACLDDATGMAVPQVPPDLAGILTRCLRNEPRHRPRSMTGIADELAAAYRRVTGREYPRPVPRAADLRGDELNNQALSLLDLGRSAEAEKKFAEALAADPRHVQAAYHLGLMRWRRGAISDETIVTQLESVRADTGGSWRARFLLAQVHMERGDLDAARELLDGVAREQPDEPEVRAALRDVRTGRITDARCTGTREMAWMADPPPRTGPPLALCADREHALSGEADGTVRLWTLHDGRCRLTLTGHGGPVSSVAISADGTRAISAGDDHTVLLWNLIDGRREHTFQAKYGRVRLSADGRTAVYSAFDGAFRVVDTRSGRVTRTVQAGNWGRVSPVVSPDGRWAMTSDTGSRAEVRLWNLATGECRYVLPEPIPGSASAGCFSTDGRFAATYGPFDGPIRIWDAASGRCVRVLEDAGPSGPMSLSDGARYLISVQGAYLRFWDVASGRCVRRFLAHRGGARAVLLSADGRSALSTGKDDTVRWWRLPHGRHVALPSLSRPRPHTELSDSDATVDALVAESERALSDDRVATALDLLTRARTVPGHERTSRVMSAWRVLARHSVRTGLRAGWVSTVLTGHRREVDAVDISAGGRLAVSGGSDRTVRLWDLDTGTCVRVLEGHRHSVSSVCLSPDGRQVLSGDGEGAVRLWETETGECLHVLADNFSLLDPARWQRVEADEYITVEDDPGGTRGSAQVPMEAVFGDAHVRFSADGRLGVVGHGDGMVRLWDLATGEQVRAIDTVDFGGDAPHAHDVGVSALAVGGGGRLIASGHGGSGRRGASVRLWDVVEGRAVGSLRSEPDGKPVFRPAVTALSLSADGRLALSSDKSTMKTCLWDIATGQCLREFGENFGWAFDVRFTSDGRFAVSAGFPGICVWEVSSGRRLRVLDDDEGKGLRCLASTPDGSFVLGGYKDGSLRQWELDWELAGPPTSG